MLAVPVVAGSDGLRLGRPVQLFDREFNYGTGITFAQYDVMPKGGFVMLERSSGFGNLNLVLNWVEDLKRLTAGPVR